MYCISVFLKKQAAPWEAARRLLPKWPNSFHRCNWGSLWVTRVDSAFLISEFPHGTQWRSLLVHTNPRLIHTKMALEIRCCTAELLFYHRLGNHGHLGRNHLLTQKNTKLMDFSTETLDRTLRKNQVLRESVCLSLFKIQLKTDLTRCGNPYLSGVGTSF